MQKCSLVSDNKRWKVKKKKWVGTNLLVVTASLVNRWLIKAAIIHVEPWGYFHKVNGYGNMAKPNKYI